MKKFLHLFKKVDGKKVLLQYMKAHVLLFALFETLFIGFSKKSLEIVRLAVDNKIYVRLKKENRQFIKTYKEEHENDNKDQKYNPIIWTIWLQGMDNAPSIVKKCYESMKRNIVDRQIIVITEKNYTDYIAFPDYIMDKYNKGIISKVHFADLLRIELLGVYGGTWLDGTVFCSGSQKNDYKLDSELFMFQNLKPGLDGHCRAVSSWMITSYSKNPIILLTRALLHNYWKNYNFAIDYFILHDFLQMSIEAYPNEWNKVVPFSNSTPHILLLKLFEDYDEKIWNALKVQTNFHKLSYKFDVVNTKYKRTYYDVIINHDND